MPSKQELAILAQFKAANEVAAGSYSGSNRPLQAVANLEVEAILKLADRLANSPEEWTELTGIKLGQQR